MLISVARRVLWFCIGVIFLIQTVQGRVSYLNRVYSYPPYDYGYPPIGPVGGFGGFGGLIGPGGCPVCDSSVFTYCDRRLLHDACCCGDAYGVGYSYCEFADCNYLFANTCGESQLIAECCCAERSLNPVNSLFSSVFGK